MMRWDDVCERVRLTYSGPDVVGRFVIDSREAGPGDLFFALPGGRTHGGLFCEQAEQAGATCVVPPRFAAEGRVVVPRVAAALWDASKVRRETFERPVVAVTGSVGKTTTRRAVAAVLRATGPVCESPANFNNALGVPLTLGGLRPEDRFSVVEIGTSAPGEVASLSRLVRPDVAVVTAVCESHLSGLKTVERVASEKWSVRAGRPDSALFCGPDAVVGQPSEATLVAPEAESIVTSLEGTRFSWGQREWLIGTPGRQFAAAGAIAAAIGRHFGIDRSAADAALRSLVPTPRRCEVHVVRGRTIIDDTYNANPTSTRAAGRLLADLSSDRRVLVLGAMADLDAASDDLHRRTAADLRECGDELWLVGDAAEAYASGWGGPLRRFSAASEAGRAGAESLAAGESILFKASRSGGLDRGVDAMLAALHGQGSRLPTRR